VSSVRSTPLTISVLFGGAGAGIVFLHSGDVFDTRRAFLLITIVLFGFLWAQVSHLRRVQPIRWLLNPVVLCSALTLFLGFVAGNLLFLLPPDRLDALGLVPDVTPPMLKLMAMVLLAAIAMWQGYWSSLANAGSSLRAQHQFGKLLKKSNRLRPMAIPVILLASVAARVTLIRLGLYGYSSNYDALVAAGAYTQYLSLVASLGKLALVAAALQYYMDAGRGRGLLFVVLCTELLFGLLSGFKSQVALPFVVLGVTEYLITQKISKAWLIAFGAAILIAYTVIEPFRVAKNQSADYRGTSVSEIASTLLKAGTEQLTSDVSADDGVPVLFSFLARSSYAYIGSIGIDYLDRNGALPEGSPNFAQNFATAPLRAVVPRFVWSSKPLGNIGIWYSRSILGVEDSISSTAMTPVTFLYLAGGPLAIFLGFYVLGIFQRAIFFLCRPYACLGGAIVFLGFLQDLSALQDGFDDLIIVIIRQLPLLLVVQHFLFRKQLEPVAHAQDVARPFAIARSTLR
jgi:hypothetical protein